MRFAYLIDRINTAIGKAVAWSIVALTFAVCYEVFSRYVLRSPTEWAFDASYMLYGLLFMVAGPYALARNNHVRGDFLYRNWAPRRQAGLDLVLYFLFFFPGILALIYAGLPFMQMSWMMNEHSMNSPNGPPIYPFKALIPIVGVLMALQGLAEVIRCVACLRSGEWPPRLHDVEETEKLILEQAEQEGLTKGIV
ncbi:TRAP transporter small permease subunit [Microvirga mediterraneensis]|uniref:TRAP transporter small permease protein n=1 Tax=Microvirga mediterraneensis TaxID=2754695 RepID=A0A838BM93_9HYPH|nr:TRAP transporter small permease subunit [Microvirga mediterraneensis]MBA1155922.1 TRAP transporter small permease subunit [Microvirga mediterraneensis]